MHPFFSVIIPTYNRLEKLVEVIRALERQADAPEFELIIVNDGSTDGTKGWLESHPFSVGAKILSQRNSGPAAARNAGIEAASGSMIAFLGDDTVPAQGWLAAHRNAHKSRSWPPKLAVIGYTGWHPDIKTTPFLHYVNEYGHQFGYALIHNPEDVPFNFFYASNLSLPAELLKADRFDLRFPFACWEDIELGYRLSLRGLRIVFDERAVVHHKHKTSLRSFILRQEKVGRSAVTFYKIHPEIDIAGLTEEGPPLQYSWISHLWRKALVSICQRLPLRLPKLWERVLRYHYLKGLHREWNRIERKCLLSDPQL